MSLKVFGAVLFLVFLVDAALLFKSTKQTRAAPATCVATVTVPNNPQPLPRHVP